jgi:hypothetical protein
MNLNSYVTILIVSNKLDIRQYDNRNAIVYFWKHRRIPSFVVIAQMVAT